MEVLEAGHERQEGVISRKRGFAPPPFIQTIKYLFLQLLAFFVNHVGMEVKKDPKAIVVEKWYQDKFFYSKPGYSTALNGDFLIPDNSESREYYLDLESKGRQFTVKVTKKVHDEVSYQDTVTAFFQEGRFDDSKLNGIRVVIPT